MLLLQVPLHPCSSCASSDVGCSLADVLAVVILFLSVRQMFLLLPSSCCCRCAFSWQLTYFVAWPSVLRLAPLSFL